MKAIIIFAALLGLAASMPTTTEPFAPTDGKSFNVDLSGLADGVLETRDDTGDLGKRGNCPSLQTCVGHRCVRLQCMPMRPGTTTCITYKYGNC